MTASLELLDGVRWQGRPIAGERPGALLAALAASRQGVGDAGLIAQVWGEEQPANPGKALQVLVSRLRSIERDLVVRDNGGYRLGVASVDAWEAVALADEAGALLGAGDATGAQERASAALAYAVADGDPGPLADLRHAVRRRLDDAGRVEALALARAGHAVRARPLLADRHQRRPDDTEVTAELLRTESVVSGPAAALDAYETYRADLAERLGVDPDPELRRLHRELLAADRPVRTGVHYETDRLFGREQDLADLRSALATGRLTTVLGPGGIGKTSIAQVLARESTLPRVHVIELVGVGSGDDVVAEIGAALGVRGSVTNRRTLTPAQQADVRGRLAEELDSAPTLLVLDNCEHVLEPVAALVAYLLVTTRDLRVLTTSRAPLRIAAERAVPLTQLATSDAAALFGRRAEAVRPGVELDEDQVAAVVERLDGLPLAIELAAARVRTMSVAEVGRALADRFETLRTRDRTAPERHRTLAAVIGWSWDLLGSDEQRALARLSVFHDGFDAETSRAMLGLGALDLVETLVEQSLLVVTEHGGVSRFRALETIREYAALRLTEGGQRSAAESAQDGWALGLAAVGAGLFVDPDQIRTVDRLVREENNLTDVLRRAIARRDASTAARLLAGLASTWTVTGNHARILILADSAAELLADLDPEPAERTAVQDATALMLMHLSWVASRSSDRLAEALQRWGEPRTPWAAVAALMQPPGPEEGVDAALTALAEAAPDPVTTSMYLMWAAILSENGGDLAASADHTRSALAMGPLPPYLEAALHSQLAQLMANAGDHARGARHAAKAWPVLARLHAIDDARAMRVGVALAHVLDGDADACDRVLDEVERDFADGGQLGSQMLLLAGRGEARLARGDVEGGLAAYGAAVDSVAGVSMPGLGLVPWLAIAATGSLVAHTLYAADDRLDSARWLRGQLGECLNGSIAPQFADLPFAGVVLVGLGGYYARWGEPEERDDASRLFAIAHCWSYNRGLPVTAWANLHGLAERVRPGRLDELIAEYVDRPPGHLRGEALVVLGRLGVVTSSG